MLIFKKNFDLDRNYIDVTFTFWNLNYVLLNFFY